MSIADSLLGSRLMHETVTVWPHCSKRASGKLATEILCITQMNFRLPRAVKGLTL